MRVELRVEDHPAAADVAVLDEQVAAFTLRATRQGAPRPLAVFAHAGDDVVGGVHGWTWGGCCELVALWVRSSRRGQGLGRALLAEAEATARARGCAQVVLFTHDVRTPSLYHHAGYDLVGQVDGYPAGGAAYWFRKRLDRRPVRVPAGRLVQTVVNAVVALVVAEAVADELGDVLRTGRVRPHRSRRPRRTGDAAHGAGSRRSWPPASRPSRAAPSR